MFRLSASVAVVACVSASPAPDQRPNLLAEYEAYVNQFGKHYDDSSKDVYFAAFAKNYQWIEEENKKDHSYKLGLNAFTDFPRDLFIATRFNHNRTSKPQLQGLMHLGEHQLTGQVVPDSVDWRQHGAVSPVKDQGSCGSCWSFGATGALEGAWKIATNQLSILSEQQFVNCDYNLNDGGVIFGGVNYGCFGGEPYYAFDFASSHALCTESSYPYTAGNQNAPEQGTDAVNPKLCSQRMPACSVAIPQGRVQGYKLVSRYNEGALMDAVASQPVSIQIEADADNFRHYTSGVLSSSCGSMLDHAVLCIGYGTLDGQNYWLVKNSWGASWGLDGYIRLFRGKIGAGECGIKESAHYPVVSKTVASVVV